MVVISVRTYKTQIKAKSHIPKETFRYYFNFLLDRKRVIDMGNLAKEEENAMYP